MDEVDNIIIHSLRQIGCDIDDDIISLSGFPPELLIKTVSKCLQLIKPSLVLPKSLPQGMAQRFTVTASLAEAVSSIGFCGEIGYQTFLYSNISEVRRVFMFLIERLPKENEKLTITQPIDKLTSLENDIMRTIVAQLHAPWIPQYCKKSGTRKCNNNTSITLSCGNSKFQPQINLNIPKFLKTNEEKVNREVHNYWLKRSPSIFQQTNTHTICPSVIHTNDIEFHSDDNNINVSTLSFNNLVSTQNRHDVLNICNIPKLESMQKSVEKLSINVDSDKQLNSQAETNSMKPLGVIELLKKDLDKIRSLIELQLTDRKDIVFQITKLKEMRAANDQNINEFKEERKINERTCILMENPEINVSKIESIIAASEGRIKHLQIQWEEHRKPLIDALNNSTSKNSDKFIQNKLVLDQIKNAREKALEITDDLKMKTFLYGELANQLQKHDTSITREAYTSRILEIIGNIRKQKNDIDKVLRDTRDLQKQINTISGQLDRQFTVTDDFIFKTAKRDESSKKAYKLLATLHSDCSELVSLVQETGSIMREVRELDDQIENEKARNVSSNLEKITSDLKQMEKECKDLQEKIRKVENQITIG